MAQGTAEGAGMALLSFGVYRGAGLAIGFLCPPAGLALNVGMAAYTAYQACQLASSLHGTYQEGGLKALERRGQDAWDEVQSLDDRDRYGLYSQSALGLFVGRGSKSKASDATKKLMSRVNQRFTKSSLKTSNVSNNVLSKGFAKPPKGGVKNFFPKNPKDLLPNLPRDAKGRIYASDKIRINPEQHLLKPNEIYNSRHHGQHYHVEVRTNPSKSWNNENYTYYLKPDSYQKGMGTGFIPGETFPGG
ncbi:hypothetical protein SCG7109_AE_00170 [Chlamydiales bacterium SCGC AG-110-M15]|nr:hypothetical protein SCG7109_AE_00170 [Chlamydiales bacterium SCGC AG-110-M15]